jgi:O-antigen/teichoic acid export membrane protein/GGDEF domain-containing protein
VTRAARPQPAPPGQPPNGPQGHGAEGSSLRQLAVQSGAYLAGRELAGMVVRLAGLVVVVHKIGPSGFGVYSAAAVFVMFALGLSQMGVEVLLVRTPGEVTSRRYAECFTLLLVTSAVVTAAGIGLTFVLAPWLRPVGVVLPLRVLLLSVPVNVLWAPAQAAIERRFAYRRMGLLELGGDVVLYATAVPLALAGFGPWSLVVGTFAWQAWLLVGATVLSGVWPRLAWSTATAREVLRHGTSYSLSGWVVDLTQSVLTLIVGASLGAAGVGYYALALRLVRTLIFTSRGVHRVGMVAVAQAKERTAGRLASALEEGTLLLLVVTIVPLAGLAVTARWIVPAVFGAKFAPAVPLYALVALSSALRMPAIAQRTVLYAYGRNVAVLVANLIEMVLTCSTAVLFVADFGVDGCGYAGLVALVAVAYTHVTTRRIVPVHYGRLVVPASALLPLLVAPLLPPAWIPVTFVPSVLLFVLPAGRRETAWFVLTLRSALKRRTQTAPPAPVPAVPPPATSPPPAPVPVPAPIVRAATRAASVLAVVAPPRAVRVPQAAATQRASRPVPAARAVTVHSTPSDERGAEMNQNGNGNSGHAADWTAEVAPLRTADGGGAAVATPWEGRDGEPVTGSIFEPPAPLYTPAGASPVHPTAGPFAAYDPAGGPDQLLSESDSLSGLPSAGALLARLGRLLSVTGTGWQLLVGALRVAAVEGWAAVGAPRPVVVAAADALRANLRFDDPVARVAPATFAFAMPFLPGSRSAAQIAEHLRADVARAVGGAVVGEPPAVEVGHVVASLPTEEEADDLVRKAVRAVGG